MPKIIIVSLFRKVSITPAKVLLRRLIFHEQV